MMQEWNNSNLTKRDASKYVDHKPALIHRGKLRRFNRLSEESVRLHKTSFKTNRFRKPSRFESNLPEIVSSGLFWFLWNIECDKSLLQKRR